MNKLYDSLKDLLPFGAKPWSSPSLERMDYGPTGNNAAMIQFFTWNSCADGSSWWKHFEEHIPRLSAMGFTRVWLPPPNKDGHPQGRGYGAYDLWDLGEFDQRGATRTRWGTRDEFVQACIVAKNHGVEVIIDAVLGHKVGADRAEKCMAVEVHPDNRMKKIGPRKEIEAYTSFEFPGRGDKYSSLKWNHNHFSGVDYDRSTRKRGIYYIEGPRRKFWSDHVDKENGNYDYLLGADIDHRQPDVRDDMLSWGVWILQTTGASGFRFDAIKHYDRRFLKEFLRKTRKETGNDKLLAIAEAWTTDYSRLSPYIRDFEGQMAFFDVPLHYNLHEASKPNSDPDLRKILRNSILEKRPGDAVTFVDNHDTQIGQTLESWVHKSFKVQSYALILLHGHGFPCVFYGDLFPNEECYDAETAAQLEQLLGFRKLYAYGDTTEYFNYRNCIGFVRSGTNDRTGCAVVIRSSAAKQKSQAKSTTYYGEEIKMRVGSQANYRDLLGDPREVAVSPDGWGVFPCRVGRVSVWVATSEGEPSDYFGILPS